MVSADGRSFGLSPIPDAVYRIYFSAWNQPTELTLYSNEFVFADRWMPVLYARARYYMWQFKESPQQAAFALNEYKEGLSSFKIVWKIVFISCLSVSNRYIISLAINGEKPWNEFWIVS